MTFESFLASIHTGGPPPAGLSPELEALWDLFEEQEREFGKDEAAARAVNGSGNSDARRAAIILVCSTVLASDAAVMCR